jgi:ligand-binding SRPBCC domain-containing protein
VTTSFEAVSKLPAPAESVWTFLITPEGINDELRPFLRMTVPRALEGKTLHDVDLGTKVCRSWFLLFGVLPFDYDDIVIAEREPGRRFLETSELFSMSRWDHERTVTSIPFGCEVHDRVTFRLRRPLRSVPGLERLVAVFLKRLFAHRHRRLLARFGISTIRSIPSKEADDDSDSAAASW